MSYADLAYYKTVYKGIDPQDDVELQTALDRATDDIDIRCSGPLTESDYHANQWENLKKANCAQAEFYVQNGDVYNSTTGESATIGKYSYSGGKGGALVSPRFKQYLAASGICNSAVPVKGREPCEY